MYFTISDGVVVGHAQTLPLARDQMAHAFAKGAADVAVCKIVLRTYTLMAAEVATHMDMTKPMWCEEETAELVEPMVA